MIFPRIPKIGERGDVAVTCPKCGFVLFEQMRAEDVPKIGRIQCPECREWSSGLNHAKA